MFIIPKKNHFWYYLIPIHCYSILNLKYDHPVLVQILELYTEMTREGREIVFIWVPGHVGIRGNSAADSAAKDALDGDISVELIPFSDLKPRTNKYILELWQSEWDEFPENKLYKIFPVLIFFISCPRKNRKEETVMARLHIGHSFLTRSFLLKGEEPPMCIGCDKTFNHKAYFTYLFGFYWNKREPLYS